MVTRPAHDDEVPRWTRRAQSVGVVYGLSGLGLATLSAFGLNQLAHGRVAGGVGLLALAIGARWLLVFANEEWASRTSRQLRSWWRSNFALSFRTPRRAADQGRGDLLLDVEYAANDPALRVLQTSAATSLLGLIVLYGAVGWLSTVVVVALLVLAVPLYQRAGKASASLETEYQERRRLLEGRQLELLQHATELRALGAVPYGSREVAAISDSENAIALRAIRVALGSSLVTEFLSGVSIGLVAMVVGFSLLGGRVSLLRALIAVLVTSELFTHVRRFGAEFHRRELTSQALARLQWHPVGDAHAGDALVEAHALVTEANSAPIDLELRPGSRILLRGPSGAGKTTLLHTLVGWREPVSGMVQRSFARIGVISNESSLMSGTLRENLLLGRHGDDHALTEVLRELGLGDQRFSNLDDALLANGLGLSSGERVRVVLARALLADCDVLILDDCAGVLDEESRELVRLALDRRPSLAVLEATVDTPLLLSPEQNVSIEA